MYGQPGVAFQQVEVKALALVLHILEKQHIGQLVVGQPPIRRENKLSVIRSEK